MTDTTESLLNVAQVAQLLNVPRSWIYSASESGVLPSFKVGRYRRYRPSEIEEWLKGQHQNGNGRAPR